MRKLMLAVTAAATLGLAAPVFTTAASAAPAGVHVARTDVVVKTNHGRRVVKKVVVRHGWHHGHRVTKRVVVKHRPNGTVVRKTIVRR